ncbi:MAG: tetratricopeptide repeat protein [Proteobacteria bacterium]|nr:tetratricopeptide repeat protein [Pseudomonadota bacterium]
MPPFDQALFDRALRDHEAGRFEQAEKGYVVALEADPTHHPTLHAYGVLAHQTGRAALAEELLQKAIARNRQNQEYLLHLGVVQRGLGNIKDSTATLKRALKRAPQFSEAHFQLGLTLIDAGQRDEAVRHLRRASQLTPGNPDVLNALAVALTATKEYEEAENLLRDLLVASPEFVEAETNLYRLLSSRKRYQDAEQLLRQAISRRPGDRDSIRRLVQTFMAQGRYDDAISECDRQIADDADSWPLKHLRAVAFLESGDYQAAVKLFTILLESGPDKDRYHYNIALAYKNLGDFDCALSHCDSAIEMRAEFADAHYRRGITHLALGDFDEGLKDHEWRWRRTEPDSPWREFPQPTWRGEDVAGKKVLIWAEQGVGDHLLYANLVPHLEALGAECTYECDERLIGMLSRAAPGTHFAPYSLDPAKPLLDPAFDFQMPMASVMHRLSFSPQKHPLRRRYCEPDPIFVADCAARLPEGGTGVRIGVSWRSAREKYGARKSIPLADWDPILRGRDALFVNLQYGDTDGDIASAVSATGASVYTDPEIDRFNELEKLSSLIENLDLVITTSNVTAHLAGALGKETWILLEVSPLWYWGHTEKAFYPSVRAFRQSRVEDWTDVVERAAAELDQKMIAAGADQRRKS